MIFITIFIDTIIINIITNIILIIVATARKKVHRHKQTTIASEQTSKNRKWKRIQQNVRGRKREFLLYKNKNNEKREKVR